MQVPDASLNSNIIRRAGSLGVWEAESKKRREKVWGREGSREGGKEHFLISHPKQWIKWGCPWTPWVLCKEKKWRHKKSFGHLHLPLHVYLWLARTACPFLPGSRFSPSQWWSLNFTIISFCFPKPNRHSFSSGSSAESERNWLVELIHPTSYCVPRIMLRDPASWKAGCELPDKWENGAKGVHKRKAGLG